MSMSSPIASPRRLVWPVWKGSTQSAKPCSRIDRKVAARLWHRARDLDKRTHEPRRHGGIIGHAALQVLHTLIFDFWNYRTGRLDPGYEAIARKSNLARSTIALALGKLASLGIISWERRCSPTTDELGRFQLRQETNAYTIHPEHQWRGARPMDERQAAPLPAPDSAGFPDPHHSRLDLDAAWRPASDHQSAADLAKSAATLELDRADMLAQSKARFLRHLAEQRRRDEQKPDALAAAVHRLGLLFSRRPQ